ncbi:MAG: hypothetical protein LBH07_01940, partial [Treponema sp.]|nr:hypothetical protein [Treponema sp.]
MKGPFFLSPDKMKLRRSPWGGPALWLVVHLAILLLLLLSIFIIGPVRINTMLFDMLPRPGSSKAVMEADMIFGEKNSREVIILAAAEDFEKAKNAAALLSAEYEQSPDFENSTLYFDPSVMAEFSRYLYDYRFVIAGKETLALLENGEADELAADALAWAFGALNFAPLDNIENDPFLLVQRR